MHLRAALSFPPALKTHRGWMAVLVYCLFLFSLFSKAGISASIILLYALAIYHWLRTRSTEGVPLWLALPFLLFIVVAVASALVNPHAAENLFTLRKVYRLALPLALVPALACVDLRRLVRWYLYGVVVMGLYAIVQYHWGVDWLHFDEPAIVPFGRNGATGYLAVGAYEHLTFGAIMLLTVPIFAALALWARERHRALYALGAVMGAVGVVLSLARSSWLGMAVGVMALAAGLPRRWAVAAGTAFVVCLVGAALLLSSAWFHREVASFAGPAVVERLLVTSPTRDAERFYLWEAGLRAIKDRPWLGFGLNNTAELEPYRQQVAKEHGGFRYSAVVPIIHNSYIEVAYYLGGIGLAVYLYLWGAMLAWNVSWIRRAPAGLAFEKSLLAGITAAFCGILVESFFNHTFFEMEVQTPLLMWMGVAMFLGLQVRRRLAEA